MTDPLVTAEAGVPPATTAPAVEAKPAAAPAAAKPGRFKVVAHMVMAMKRFEGKGECRAEGTRGSAPPRALLTRARRVEGASSMVRPDGKGPGRCNPVRSHAGWPAGEADCRLVCRVGGRAVVGPPPSALAHSSPSLSPPPGDTSPTSHAPLLFPSLSSFPLSLPLQPPSTRPTPTASGRTWPPPAARRAS